MPLNYSDLAAAMEKQFGDRYLAAKNQPLPDLGHDDRMMLFGAIAQAVVEHLQGYAEVQVTDTDASGTPQVEIGKIQ